MPLLDPAAIEATATSIANDLMPPGMEASEKEKVINAYKKMLECICQHFIANGVITVSTTVTVASVSAVTPGPGVSGPGTGTGSGTGVLS